ncbi:hypothetical protein D3C78_1136890 [compost metagenome]
MIIGQRWIGLPAPALRRLVDFLREDGDADGDIDVPGLLGVRAEVVVVVFPIETCAGRAAVGQPVESDVVEHLIPGKHAFGLAIAVAPLREFLVDEGCKTDR